MNNYIKCIVKKISINFNIDINSISNIIQLGSLTYEEFINNEKLQRLLIENQELNHIVEYLKINERFFSKRFSGDDVFILLINQEYIVVYREHEELFNDPTILIVRKIN